MAVWALLSISQTVKAADFYLTGSSTLEAWVKLDGKSMTDLGGERYSQEYKCTNTAQYRFRIAGGNLGYELCPNTNSYNLLVAKPRYGCFANNVSGYADNYFYVDMVSGITNLLVLIMMVMVSTLILSLQLKLVNFVLD